MEIILLNNPTGKMSEKMYQIISLGSKKFVRANTSNLLFISIRFEVFMGEFFYYTIRIEKKLFTKLNVKNLLSEF